MPVGRRNRGGSFMHIGILGSGKMGSSLARLIANRGHTVTIGSRTPEAKRDRFLGIDGLDVRDQQAAVDEAELIIVATPWTATLETLEALDIPAGKIILDISNPLSADVSELVVGGKNSAAEEVARCLGSTRVVKAFNGINAANLDNPAFAGGTAQIPFCGDDAGAKDVVRNLIEELGFVALDCGELKNARYLEAMAMLWIQLAFVEGYGMNCAFKFSCA